MSIFCVGQSAYDITIPLEEPLVENRKYRISSRHECGGGPAFNAACLCAMWGAPVQLISRIGEDPYGKALKEILRLEGAGMDFLIPDRGMKTPYSIIIAGKENGSRTLFNFPGIRGEVDYPIPPEHPKVILTDGHEDQISLKLMHAFPDAVSVIDAGTFRDCTFAVAKEVDYLVCSEDFARQYTGKQADLSDWKACEEIFREVEKINQKHAVITLGARGLLYREEDGSLAHLPACQVQAVDSTGAGDIFHGAFAYGLYRGYSMRKNLEQCSAAAALSVQKLGSQTSIPSREATENYQ